MKYGLAAKNRGKNKTPRTKLLVSMTGFDDQAVSGAQTSDAASAAAGYAAKRAGYAARKQVARTRQAEVIAWLESHKGNGAFRRVSAPTAFGTFTLEASPEVEKLLAHAPGVESVVATDGAPMVLLTDATTASGR